MVNGPDDVYVERGGRIEKAPDGLFEGEEAVQHLIERIVGRLRVDESSPWADARLPDGSRVQTRFLCTSYLRPRPAGLPVARDLAIADCSSWDGGLARPGARGSLLVKGDRPGATRLGMEVARQLEVD